MTVNVISLAGTSGIGVNTTTHGLGPEEKPIPPPPPGPTPRKRTGGNTDEAQRVWRERWEQIGQEQAIRAGEILARRKREQLEEVEWLDESTLAEADYFIVASGLDAAIRAPAGGRMRYVRTKKYGLCAVILADTGARYLITGLGSTQDRRVEAGDIIGKTGPTAPIAAIHAADAAASGSGGQSDAPTDADTAEPPMLGPAPSQAFTQFFLTINADGEIVPEIITPSPTTTAATSTQGAPEQLPTAYAPPGPNPAPYIVVLGSITALAVVLTGNPLLASLILSGTIVAASSQKRR